MAAPNDFLEGLLLLKVTKVYLSICFSTEPVLQYHLFSLAQTWPVHSTCNYLPDDQQAVYTNRQDHLQFDPKRNNLRSYALRLISTERVKPKFDLLTFNNAQCKAHFRFKSPCRRHKSPCKCTWSSREFGVSQQMCGWCRLVELERLSNRPKSTISLAVQVVLAFVYDNWHSKLADLSQPRFKGGYNSREGRGTTAELFRVRRWNCPGVGVEQAHYTLWWSDTIFQTLSTPPKIVIILVTWFTLCH
jgi:hypothetical protein